MDDEGWARHANPWSGWTRATTVLPLLVLAFWSRVWLGWWSLLPIALALAWTWLNPRAFPPARSDAAWMTQGVLGERLWSRRDRLPLPPRHRWLPHVLNLAGMAGGLLTVWGVAVLDPWMTLVGMAVTAGAKLWYVDRMARLYREAVAANRSCATARGPWPEPSRRRRAAAETRVSLW